MNLAQKVLCGVNEAKVDYKDEKRLEELRSKVKPVLQEVGEMLTAAEKDDDEDYSIVLESVYDKLMGAWDGLEDVIMIIRYP